MLHKLHKKRMLEHNGFGELIPGFKQHTSGLLVPEMPRSPLGLVLPGEGHGIKRAEVQLPGGLRAHGLKNEESERVLSLADLKEHRHQAMALGQSNPEEIFDSMRNLKITNSAEFHNFQTGLQNRKKHGKLGITGKKKF